MVNNLNDGLAWGLFPLFFAAAGLTIAQIGVCWPRSILACRGSPSWELALSDRLGRKGLIVVGMWVQAVGIGLIVLTQGFLPWFGAMVLLGLGTAMVYPTLIATVSDVAHPDWRASAVGVYRLWRDGGYALGALLAGVLADLLGVPWAIAVIALLTFASGVVALIQMYETLPAKRVSMQPVVRAVGSIKGADSD
jgi:MFS family permease